MGGFTLELMRGPAHDTINPIPYKWYESTDNQKFIISNILNENKDLELYRNNIKITNHNTFFKLVKDKVYFIKSIPQNESSNVIEGDKISKWLSNNGNKTIYAHKIVESLKYQTTLLIYPYKNHDYWPKRELNPLSIGKCIGKLHSSMERYPKRQSIINNGIKYTNRLKIIHEDILSQSRYSRGLSTEVCKSLRKVSKISLDKFLSHKSLIHADLNIGNILIGEKYDEYYFIDFEDSIDLPLPKIFDLLVFIQRFFLKLPYNKYKEYINSLFKGYFHVIPKSKMELEYFPIDEAFSILPIISLLRLIDKYGLKNMPAKEANKFLSFSDYEHLYFDKIKLLRNSYDEALKS